MSLENAVAAAVLDQLIDGTAFAPGSPNLALGANGGAELSGTGVARIAQTFGAFTAAQPSVGTVAVESDYGTIAGDWAPASVDEGRIYSAAAAGTLLARGSDTAVALTTGRRLFVRAGLVFQVGTNSFFSAAYAQAIGEWLFRSGATPARARYLGILNSGTELSGGNYARLDTDTLWAAATVADPSVKAFTSEQVFQANATFTGANNQVGLYAASTGGSPLIILTHSAEIINSGDEVRVNPSFSLT